MFHVVGREVWYGSNRPLETGLYKVVRNQCRLYQNSAGRIVPFVSLGKPRERKGALLQLMRLDEVKDV
jgi:hypothetical protein